MAQPGFLTTTANQDRLSQRHSRHPLSHASQQEFQVQPTLYMVATPIGNLSDLTPRAREILGAVDFIACEDTRHTAKLLSHFGIQVPTESLHAHNERDKARQLVERLLASKRQRAAFVSDAGTPGISDPGAILAREARSRGVTVLAIPGASSLVAAVSVSGFLQPRQIFSGFLPRTVDGQREEFARWRAVAPCVAVFFESPNRVLATLKNLEEAFGDSVELLISREITKIHEEHIAGSPREALSVMEAKERIQGEFVVSVNLSDALTSPGEAPQKLSLEEAVDAALGAVNAGQRLKDVVKGLAEANRLDAKRLYRLVQEKRDAAVE
jgi:16S rRNA (cytidine1402-2'-O)-methyltransferase